MATLTTTIQEQVTINGKLYGNTIEKSHTSIDQVWQQVVQVGTSIQELVGFAASEKAGDIKDDTLKYMRITNNDSTNFVTLSFTIADASGSVVDSYGVKLPAGCSYILTDDDMGVSTAPASISLSQLDSINAIADTAACSVEIFIGATT